MCIRDRIYWYAASTTTGGVLWGVSVRQTTANDDDVSSESTTFEGESTVADDQIDGDDKRMMVASVTVTDTGTSLAAGDLVLLRLHLVDDAQTDIGGLANVVLVSVEQ